MFHKAHKLILDVKIRWNSLVTMLESFIELKTCILKAIIDLKEILNISDEYAVMNAITILMQPVKFGIERLDRSNASLLDSEGVLIFFFNNLAEEKIFFANKLLRSVPQRIEVRRNINLVGLLKFLNNLFSYNHESNINSKLILPSKYELKAATKKYFTRLYIEKACNTSANVVIFDESHDNVSGILA